MRKYMLIPAAMLSVVVGLAASVEAANRIQTIRSAVPKVVNTATKSLVKVGDDISSLLWRNKGTFTTGTVLVTVASNPEPFIDGAVAMVAGPPILIQDGDRTVIQKRVRSGNWNGYIFLAGLIGILGMIVLRKSSARTRTVAKIVTVALLIGLVIAWCGVARADDFGTVFAPTCAAWPFGWHWGGGRILDLVLIIVMLFLPFG